MHVVVGRIFRKAGLDAYTALLAATVLLAAFLPARGAFAGLLSHVTFWAVALLFFLYGARLSMAAIVQGLANWKLQLSILLFTFALFPLVALPMEHFLTAVLPASIGLGFLYIGCMPSTVQSSVAFTSVSNGNVAGALCAASLSNLLGVILSPLLVALLIGHEGGYQVDTLAIWKITQQILLPFAAGQLFRPILAGFLGRHNLPTMIVDRGSILLIVYAAFSAGVVNGMWQAFPLSGLALVAVLCAGLLALVMAAALGTGKILGMPPSDRLALLYCGSTKSLATGLPMASILFSGQDISMIVLPLMAFHLLQLLTCAVVSQRLRARGI